MSIAKCVMTFLCANSPSHALCPILGGIIAPSLSSEASNRSIASKTHLSGLLNGLHGTITLEADVSLGELLDEALITAKVVTEEVLDAEKLHWVALVAGNVLQLIVPGVERQREVLALLINTAEVAEPRGSGEGEAGEGATSNDLLGNGGHDELGHLARTTKADTGDLILERRVGEATDEGLDVLVDIDTRDRGKQRLDFLVHHVADVLSEDRVVDGLVNVLESSEVSRVTHSCVRGVQQTELPQLELLYVLDILDDLNANLLESGATIAELVLDNPLAERLCDDRPRILDAELVAEADNILVDSPGGDAVYHGVGESTVGREPCSDIGVVVLSEGDKHIAGDVTILLHVVARQNGERLQASLVAARQSSVYVTKESAGRRRASKIGCHVGVLSHKLVGVLVVEVTALCDGHRDDVGVWVSHLGDDSLRVVGSKQVVCDGADDTSLGSGCGTLDECVKVVLGNESVPHLSVEGLHTDTADCPVLGLELLKKAVDVNCQMGTVETTDTDVDNSMLDAGTVVGRDCAVLQRCQVGVVQLEGLRLSRVRHSGSGLRVVARLGKCSGSDLLLLLCGLGGRKFGGG
jgi:hypothetical protein